MHTDVRAAVVLLSDAAGAVAWQASYQPFGALATLSGVLSQNLRLDGQYADSETGLYQNGARDYVPSTGRYLEVLSPIDPLADPSGNPYGYADSSPLNMIEPQGRYVRPTLP